MNAYFHTLSHSSSLHLSLSLPVSLSYTHEHTPENFSLQSSDRPPPHLIALLKAGPSRLCHCLPHWLLRAQGPT